MKLAVFLPNWVGDAAMATPALAAIRTDFPDAEIVGVMRPVIADVLAGSGLIDKVLTYHPRGKDPAQRGLRFVSRLRAEHCDTAILFPNSLRSAWLAWLSGARRRIGFDRDLRGWLLTDRVPPKSKSVPHPALDEYNRLAERLGCTSLSNRMTLAVAAKDVATLNAFWAKQPPGLRERGVIAFNTGGAFGPAKSWPRESFAKMAQQIVDELGRTVLILCGPAERDEARWIAAAADRPEVVSLADDFPSGPLAPASGERVRVRGPSAPTELPTTGNASGATGSLFEPPVSSHSPEEHWRPKPAASGTHHEGTEPKATPLSIGLTKAAVQASQLLVTTDSGPRHFAAAFDVPVVTLFGPTHIAWSETHFSKATHLQIAVDCGPCQQRACPLGHHRCMRDMTVDQVFAAVRNQLSSVPQSRAA
ncbi:MAG TPA: glycosyltransferase family 9 protein [Planctomycetaceae bacterium]|nr:glycosyltransferase family 9 protein [Planctomycetaceae bacterium]